jgi:hypothetical protein
LIRKLAPDCVFVIQVAFKLLDLNILGFDHCYFCISAPEPLNET